MLTVDQCGSVSHGTMRPEDLIPCFISILREFGSKHIQRKLDLIEESMGCPGYFDGDGASIDLNESLFEWMNDIAPEGYYFGSHPGDGSDYGYWPDTEGVQDE